MSLCGKCIVCIHLYVLKCGCECTVFVTASFSSIPFVHKKIIFYSNRSGSNLVLCFCYCTMKIIYIALFFPTVVSHCILYVYDPKNHAKNVKEACVFLSLESVLSHIVVISSFTVKNTECAEHPC